MTGKIKYITQVTTSDLREIARAANLRSGLGLQVEIVKISDEAFKRMVYAFCRQAWPAACTELTIEQIENVNIRE